MIEFLTNEWFLIGFIGVAVQIIGSAIAWREKGLLPDTFGSLWKYVKTHQLTIAMSALAYVMIQGIKFSTDVSLDAYCMADAYASQEILNKFVMKGKDHHKVDLAQRQIQPKEIQNDSER